MEFIAKGRVTLEGVIFYIEADNLECAKSIAFGDQFTSCNFDAAEIVDADIAVASIEENA